MAQPPGKQPSGQSGQSLKSRQQVHERTWPRFASLLNMRMAPDGLALFAQGLCGVTRKFCVRGLVWVGRPCDRWHRRLDVKSCCAVSAIGSSYEATPSYREGSLGRARARGGEASERRGGQAMVRARRACVVVPLAVLPATATADGQGEHLVLGYFT